MRRSLAALLLVAAALLTGGCGTGGLVGEGADTANGKQLFQQRCASCHALADIGSTSRVGPDLDDAFAANREQGFAEAAIRDLVRDQIDYAAPPMPTNLVEGKDADDVAAYVASVAGVPGKGKAAAASTDGRTLFLTNCQGCHVLAAANATGTTGPNLDEQKPGLEETRRQVTNGGGGMPAFKGQLSPKQIEAVSQYVAKNAGR